jgi:hypothetical protein
VINARVGLLVENACGDIYIINCLHPVFELKIGCVLKFGDTSQHVYRCSMGFVITRFGGSGRLHHQQIHANGLGTDRFCRNADKIIKALFAL